jgi:hypothetical protein
MTYLGYFFNNKIIQSSLELNLFPILLLHYMYV